MNKKKTSAHDGEIYRPDVDLKLEGKISQIPRPGRNKNSHTMLPIDEGVESEIASHVEIESYSNLNPNASQISCSGKVGMEKMPAYVKNRLPGYENPNASRIFTRKPA